MVDGSGALWRVLTRSQTVSNPGDGSGDLGTVRTSSEFGCEFWDEWGRERQGTRGGRSGRGVCLRRVRGPSPSVGPLIGDNRVTWRVVSDGRPLSDHSHLFSSTWTGFPVFCRGHRPLSPGTDNLSFHKEVPLLHWGHTGVTVSTWPVDIGNPNRFPYVPYLQATPVRVSALCKP